MNVFQQKQQGDSATAQHQIAVQREPSRHNVIRTKSKKTCGGNSEFPVMENQRDAFYADTPEKQTGNHCRKSGKP